MLVLPHLYANFALSVQRLLRLLTFPFTSGVYEAGMREKNSCGSGVMRREKWVERRDTARLNTDPVD